MDYACAPDVIKFYEHYKNSKPIKNIPLEGVSFNLEEHYKPTEIIG